MGHNSGHPALGHVSGHEIGGDVPPEHIHPLGLVAPHVVQVDQVEADLEAAGVVHSRAAFMVKNRPGCSTSLTATEAANSLFAV